MSGETRPFPLTLSRVEGPAVSCAEGPALSRAEG
jgi:hypothetical protein